MSAIQSLLVRNRVLADEHRQNMAQLESGKVRIFAGPGQTDEITAQWIEIYKGWIAELEDIEVKYGGSNA